MTCRIVCRLYITLGGKPSLVDQMEGIDRKALWAKEQSHEILNVETKRDILRNSQRGRDRNKGNNYRILECVAAIDKKTTYQKARYMKII